MVAVFLTPFPSLPFPSHFDSHIVNGFALNVTRAAQGMPTTINNAKIAFLDINLQRHRMAMGVQVVVKDPKEVEQIRQVS